MKYGSQEQKDALRFLTVQNAAWFGKLAVSISITPPSAFSVFHHFKAECQQLQWETPEEVNKHGNAEAWAVHTVQITIFIRNIK